MNLQEMGDIFRQERERQGLTVEDVVQRTKISRRNVQALEAGRKEDFPHPVYAKGFVKNYARLLGLNPEDFAQALAREYFVAEDDFGNDPTRDKPISMNAARSNVGVNRRSGLRGLLLLLLAVGVGAGIIWSMLLEPRDRPAPSLPAPQAAPAAPVPSESGAAEQDRDLSSGPGPSAPEGVCPPPSAAPGNEAPTAAQDAAPAAVPAPNASAPAAPPAPKPAPIASAVPVAPPAPKPAPAAVAPERPAEQAPDERTRIMGIKANQLCWVYAEVDGSIILDMTLQPGEAKLIHFDKALVVKFGNAGGVAVSLDNKPFPLNAQSGEVRTVTIP